MSGFGIGKPISLKESTDMEIGGIFANLSPFPKMYSAAEFILVCQTVIGTELDTFLNNDIILITIRY